MKLFKRIGAVIALMALMCTFMACGKKPSIVGSWTGNDDGYEISMEFNEDGTGKYTLSGISLTITSYETNGDQLTINQSVLGGTQTVVYTYSLDKKGNTLTISNESGSVEFTRK
ncbi:MAG: DUF5640 domain-containing protein [Eubacteriales bacterium]|nr:DUF5640 domain-containing protein [Eubacteriales bacterium]